MIEVRELSKAYGGRTVVDRLTFAARPGRVTGFLGPNGAGKSTTLRMVLGLDRPDGGAALVDGRPYAALADPLRRVGALLDGRAFHPGRSARNHLRALAAAGGLPERRVGEVLDRVGLASVADRRAGTYSLGMGQRLGVAAALLGDPDVLILDEPVNGLDPDGIRWIRELVRSLAAEGRTVLLSSHLIAEMAQTADDVVIVGRGRHVAATSVDELRRTAPRHVVVRSSAADDLAWHLRTAGHGVEPQPDGALHVVGASAEEVADLAAAARIPVHELTPAHASLEEVFMELTHDSVEYAGVSS